MTLVGKWRSDAVCIELFGNGDFQLSLLADEPKIQILGAATLEHRKDDAKLNLEVKRIWKGRFVSNCRKTHELGDFIDSADALGLVFSKGKQAALTLKVSGETAKLCGTQCTDLTRETPILAGRWRRDAMKYPDHPEKPWADGDLLELKLGRSSSHLWKGGSSSQNKIDELSGTAVARFVDTDSFAIELTVDKTVHKLTATRLADEKLKVCDSNERCAVLVRQFDAYHYDLE